MDENEVVQNASEQDTTATMETQQAIAEEGYPETSPQGGENTEEIAAPGGENSAEQEEAPAEPFLEISYNHEKRGLTREEAATWAQKGIHYEKLRNDLERLATLKGVSVNEFVKGLEAAEDEAYRNSLMDKFGGDEDTVEQMMELYNIKKQQTLDNANKNKAAAAAAEEQSVNARIADEFTKMKREFPELTEFSALPAEVKQAALQGKALPYAYLEFKHKEAKKIAAAAAAEENAAKKSTGSMSTDGHDTGNDPFIDGIFGR